MAKPKKNAQAISSVPECPVCMEDLTAPIFQCTSGHSLCSSCTQALQPPICPICREAMTQMRNWQLEDIINQAKRSCPNKQLGCVYAISVAEMQSHLNDCIFREMECPIGTLLGKCSWSGQYKDLLKHFQEHHPTSIQPPDTNSKCISNINFHEDERYITLITLHKSLFMMTVKIDTLAKVAFWVVQKIGSENMASKYVYDIHITSTQNNSRKFNYTDICYNDATKADKIFQLGKCVIMPLNVLQHFVKDRKLTFTFAIRRIEHSQQKNTGGNQNNDEGARAGTKGPGAKGLGPKGPGFKGPGPKGPGFKSPGGPGFKGPGGFGFKGPGGPGFKGPGGPGFKGPGGPGFKGPGPHL